MKSEKAESIIRAREWMDEEVGVRAIYSQHAMEAVEAAEQEAEKRMREKASRVFCLDCPIYPIQTSNGGVCKDCATKKSYIQKLNEE